MRRNIAWLSKDLCYQTYNQFLVTTFKQLHKRSNKKFILAFNNCFYFSFLDFAAFPLFACCLFCFPALLALDCDCCCCWCCGVGFWGQMSILREKIPKITVCNAQPTVGIRFSLSFWHLYTATSASNRCSAASPSNLWRDKVKCNKWKSSHGSVNNPLALPRYSCHPVNLLPSPHRAPLFELLLMICDTKDTCTNRNSGGPSQADLTVLFFS